MPIITSNIERLNEIKANAINPLDHEKHIIVEGRRVGNTTRLVNEIIEMLLFNPTVGVLMKDHYDNGNCKRANEMLRKRVLKRLMSENRITYRLFEVNNREILKLKDNRKDW